jgi:putative endonuclease
MSEKQYFVYIMSSVSKVLYIGVTNNLPRRIAEHRGEGEDSFVKKYCATKLVYYETTTDIRAAIAIEKQLKGWRREKKIALIESLNPQWNDLSAEWQ